MVVAAAASRGLPRQGLQEPVLVKTYTNPSKVPQLSIQRIKQSTHSLWDILDLNCNTTLLQIAGFARTSVPLVMCSLLLLFACFCRLPMGAKASGICGNYVTWRKSQHSDAGFPTDPLWWRGYKPLGGKVCLQGCDAVGRLWKLQPCPTSSSLSASCVQIGKM